MKKHNIQIIPINNIEKPAKEFSVEEDETILDGALRQGIVLAYGCKNGGCGTCKAKIHQGNYRHTDELLNSGERSQGLALLCSTYAQSDLKIEAKILEGIADMHIKKMPCRIASLQQKTEDIMQVKLQLPSNQSFTFAAGQYIDLLLKNNVRRSYSIASQPLDDVLELHIRHMSGGLFTDSLFGASNSETKLKERDILRFEGPLGTFFVRNNQKPLLFLASGTGFAPIQSMINQLYAQKDQRSITLYWGGRRPKDLYALDICAQWQQQMPHFNFIPVISNACDDDVWQGRTGFLHHAAMQDIPNMSAYDVYACGAPIMVDAARKDFTQQCRLSDDAFFADAFLSQADK
jgi:CDP-4-dehydro-6-deoxyglucose reductase, E3